MISPIVLAQRLQRRLGGWVYSAHAVQENPRTRYYPRLNAILGEKMRFTEISDRGYPAHWEVEAPVEAAPEIICPICHGQEFHITGEGRRYCLRCPWEDE